MCQAQGDLEQRLPTRGVLHLAGMAQSSTAWEDCDLDLNMVGDPKGAAPGGCQTATLPMAA